jgi:hypothetical protein
MLVPYNQLVCILMVDDAANNFEDSILRTGSIEYNIILQNIPIFSNIHKLG